MTKCEDCPNEFTPNHKTSSSKYPHKCKRCRQKLYTQTHIDNHYEAYLHKARMRHKWVAYGLTEEVYRGMYSAQGDACAICRKPFPDIEKREKKVAVDHDHKTGIARELLCQRCNNVLGRVSDNPDLLLAMVEYLRKHSPDVKN